jgi:hypothetical protein
LFPLCSSICCPRNSTQLAMPFGVAHTIILRIAKWAVGSFFDTIEVINGDNVPKTGPVIMYEQQ